MRNLIKKTIQAETFEILRVFRINPRIRVQVEKIIYDLCVENFKIQYNRCFLFNRYRVEFFLFLTAILVKKAPKVNQNWLHCSMLNACLQEGQCELNQSL